MKKQFGFSDEQNGVLIEGGRISVTAEFANCTSDGVVKVNCKMAKLHYIVESA